ncbi:MAG: ABC transporter ATP-binding protein [Eubacterium sp.]|nr:ABC transporter ATP-binding protein [Eubacterium sp.]
MTDQNPVVQLCEFNLWIRKGSSRIQVLKNLSLSIHAGERWGIAGESGAGKSMTMYSLLSLLPEKSTEVSGKILYRSRDGSMEELLQIPYKKRHAYCANHAAVILQDSINALNPFERIEKQWIPTVRLHHPEMEESTIRAHLLERMERFGIAGGEEVLRKYPHQLSGGMKQRIAIAMALESNAGILIADEPTTSLDTVNQRKIISFIDEICRTEHLTLLYISHNLGIVQHLCTHAAILKDGEITGQGKLEDVFFRTESGYTAQLIRETEKLYSSAGRQKDFNSADKSGQEELLRVENVTKTFPKMAGGFRKSTFTAAEKISFSVHKGEIIGLLGESGCGKSTLAKVITGLIPPTSGNVFFRDTIISGLDSHAYRPFRRSVQMIFQNPFDSLDPRMKVRNILLEPLRLWKIGKTKEEREKTILQMCRDCGLSEASLEKYPTEFSGGQLQRIAIARALLVRPEFLIADEIVSALDVSVQNQILELLLQMKEKYGLTILFITHDLAVIRRISDRVMVMQGGHLLACGRTEEVLDQPEQPYIRSLTDAAFFLRRPAGTN